MQSFLTYVVEGRLAGGFHSEDLKESVIGMAVFNREAAYDPKSDPVVRVEARRLRTKIEEYYAGPGQLDAIRISLPKGSYVPSWEWQGKAEELANLPVPPSRTRSIILLSLAAALIAVLGGVAATGIWKHFLPTRNAPANASRIRSLAVLPFRNLSGDPSKDYLVNGLTDELTTELAKVQNLIVISRTSADQYRGTTKNLPEIARELKVDAIVEGTFLNSPSFVRVSAQLIRAATDTNLWGETYERSGSDFFTLDTEIAASIAQQIGLTISPAAREAVIDHPITFAAFEAYLRGRFFWNKRTLEGLEKSIDYYKRAIMLDPNYGKAYAALGDSYVLLSSYGGPSPAESLLRAREAADEALRLDPSLAEAHTVLAAVKIDNDWDWKGATREYQRALRLSPSYPTAHHWFSLHLSRLGRHKEAEAQIKRALELDPLSLIITTDAGEVFYCARNPNQALVYLNRALELDPNFAEAHLVLGKVYEQKGNFSRALAEFQIADKLFGGLPNVWALEGHALALAGKRAEANAIARKLEIVSKQRYVSGVDKAIVYCGLGDASSAMSALDRAYQKRDKGLDILGADPLFDGCRSDARFQALLKRLQLVQ